MSNRNLTMSPISTPIKKSVLISGGALGRGGARTHLRLLSKVLRQADAEVSISATASEWSLEEIEELQDWGVKFLTPPKLLLSRPLGLLHSLTTAPICLRKPFTSLYCISTGRSHRYLRRWVPSETIGIYHEIVSTPTSNSLGWHCASSLGTIVANSEKIGNEMANLFSSVPLQVIPFLTADAPTPAPPHRSSVGSRELRVVYLGRLVSHKRPDRLVKDWAKLSAIAPLNPARLDVYGYDPNHVMLNELRSFITDNGLSDQVRMHGNYEPKDLPRILDQADVVVLPSLMEGLPLVLVEAMQRGVAVVATSAGGTAELGSNNPDVIITDVEWDSFVDGLLAMSGKLRSGQIDSLRLHQWTEQRYGYTTVAQKWIDALLTPRTFFGMSA